MAVLGTQDFHLQVLQVKLHGHYRSQTPEYHGQQETYGNYTNRDRTLATSNPEAVTI